MRFTPSSPHHYPVRILPHLPHCAVHRDASATLLTIFTFSNAQKRRNAWKPFNGRNRNRQNLHRPTTIGSRQYRRPTIRTAPCNRIVSDVEVLSDVGISRSKFLPQVSVLRRTAPWLSLGITATCRAFILQALQSNGVAPVNGPGPWL